MNEAKSVPVNLRIMDKDYVVACPENEKETLLNSASYLMEKIQVVREGGKVVSTERMAVMSALNIVHEFLQYRQQTEQDMDELNQKLNNLQHKIDLVLSRMKA